MTVFASFEHPISFREFHGAMVAKIAGPFCQQRIGRIKGAIFVAKRSAKAPGGVQCSFCWCSPCLHPKFVGEDMKIHFEKYVFFSRLDFLDMTLTKMIWTMGGELYKMLILIVFSSGWKLYDLPSWMKQDVGRLPNKSAINLHQSTIYFVS